MNAVRGVSLLPGGRRVLSSSQDKTVRLWDVETGDLLKTYQGATTFVTATPSSEISHTPFGSPVTFKPYQFRSVRSFTYGRIDTQSFCVVSPMVLFFVLISCIPAITERRSECVGELCGCHEVDIDVAVEQLSEAVA